MGVAEKQYWLSRVWRRPFALYELGYGLMYEEWVEEKAERIRGCLREFYVSGAPIDLQVLAERVYRERLMRTSKPSWMPIRDRFTDLKPSPFIKNFLAHLIARLAVDGYIMCGWLVEAHERARASDLTVEASKARIYSAGMRGRVVEVADGARASEPSLEVRLQPVKVVRQLSRTYVEIREAARASDLARGVEAAAGPPATEVTYARRVLKVPPLEYLRELCTWKDA